jgi:nitroreductase
MDALHNLATRSSTPSRLLGTPGPNEQQLQQLLALAMRVPDHGKLAPWRFVSISGDAKQALCERMRARKLELEPDATDDALQKEAQRFAYAPLVLAVVSTPVLNHKIPLLEQQASASAVCMQLLNAAHALGFGAQWLTGWAAYDVDMLEYLGVRAPEALAGFIHIGTASERAPERARPDWRDKLSALRA